MRGKLYLGLQTEDTYVIEKLKRFGVRKISDTEVLLPLEKLKDVKETIGQDVVLEDEDLKMLKEILSIYEEKVIVAETKRKTVLGSDFTVTPLLNNKDYYILKTPTSQRELLIPVRAVNAYLRVLSNLKKSGIKSIKKRDLVALTFKELGLFSRYDRNGKFHWEAFYGDRTMYHIYYYGPIKIIEKMNLIKVLPNDKILIG